MGLKFLIPAQAGFKQSLNILHCIQFDGAHEGNECKVHDKGCHCRSTWDQHGDQEESVRKDHQQPCRNCHAGSKEHWSVHHPWCLQDQNPNEASNQGREEGSLWQSGDGQGKASKKSGEGISCLCLEAERMRWMESGRYNTCTCGVSHM